MSKNKAQRTPNKFKFYFLDNHKEIVGTDDIKKWGQFFEKNNLRRVAKTQIGESFISTVFLGLGHSFVDGGDPVLWETLVFGGPLNDKMDRCSGKWADAVAMHKRMVKKVKKSVGESNGL